MSQNDPLLQKVGNFQPLAPYCILPYIWSKRTIPYHNRTVLNYTVPYTVLAHH